LSYHEVKTESNNEVAICTSLRRMPHTGENFEFVGAIATAQGH